MPDTNRLLDEIVVTAGTPRRSVSVQNTGRIVLNSTQSSEQPTFMGGNDPLAILKSLPAIATNNDLQAAVSVRGSSTGSNLFETDGMRLIKPLHMLGLYSTFNPAFYSSYEFMPGFVPANKANVGAGYFNAISAPGHNDKVTGAVSVGLIESHGAVHIPIRSIQSRLSIGFRRSYLDLVFPNILKLGDSDLKYSFTDINLAFDTRLDSLGSLHFYFFGNRDVLDIESEKHGQKEGDFNWKNFSVGTKYIHRQWSAMLSASRLSNYFFMTEGARDLKIPSSFLQVTGRAEYSLGYIDFEGDVNYRNSSGQYNKAVTDSKALNGSESFDFNVGAQWDRKYFDRLNISAGLRLSYYHNGHYNAFYPQPRIHVGYELPSRFELFASYGRYIMFDRLVEESNVGLPNDFVMCADRNIPPEDNNSFQLGISGYIPRTFVYFNISGYYKFISNSIEYVGSLLNFTNPTYNSLDDVETGRGYATGVSVLLMRNIGKLRGRVSYNYGVSRVRLLRYGTDWNPSAHDRPHDLGATVSYSPLSELTLSAFYTYATGSPYTRAKYGYMIGENLICEYFPHNSSRLPPYRRMDVSVQWNFKPHGRVAHRLNLSVYNVLANKNVLFRYTAYSLDSGIQQKQSVMKAVIPSLTYTVEF